MALFFHNITFVDYLNRNEKSFFHLNRIPYTDLNLIITFNKKTLDMKARQTASCYAINAFLEYQ